MHAICLLQQTVLGRSSSAGLPAVHILYLLYGSGVMRGHLKVLHPASIKAATDALAALQERQSASTSFLYRA